MSIADHTVVPGKKFFTWGDSPNGHLQDTLLTDSDGPYIELMVGAYSDNQPDYSWLQPFDVKSFSMNWYPFRELGGVKNANLDAAVSLVGVEAALGDFNQHRLVPKRRQETLVDHFHVMVAAHRPLLHPFGQQP